MQNFIFSCPGWNTLKKYLFFLKYIDINILDLFSKIVSCTCFQMLTCHVKNVKVDSQLLVNILIAWSFSLLFTMIRRQKFCGVWEIVSGELGASVLDQSVKTNLCCYHLSANLKLGPEQIQM